MSKKCTSLEFLHSFDEATKYIILENQSLQYLEFPEEPLHVETNPGPYCIPEEIFTYKPGLEQIFIFFFKGTPKEICIRQIFFHTPLNDREQKWLKLIREYFKAKHFPLRRCLDPFLLRICYFTWRKTGDRDFLPKAYAEILETLNWRAEKFPISDTEPDVAENLTKGIAYWAARDEHLRPLLVIRLIRLPLHILPQRFKRLIIFCFEWAIRYLFVPGIVETCVVLIDTRGVALRRFPISALIDITTMLTRQYPFRLHRMFVLNDSILIQTIWNVVRQFLSEVQQQKILLVRMIDELFKTFSPLHIEKQYGGVRDEITCFYPFPLLPGPFNHDTPSLNYNAKRDLWKCISTKTSRGVVWEGSIRTPLELDFNSVRQLGSDCTQEFQREKKALSSHLLLDEVKDYLEHHVSDSAVSMDMAHFPSNNMFEPIDVNLLPPDGCDHNRPIASKCESGSMSSHSPKQNPVNLVSNLSPSRKKLYQEDISKMQQIQSKAYHHSRLSSFLRFNCYNKRAVKP